jgi:photosystem II stability/assembly factor-like uncharacterized protein
MKTRYLFIIITSQVVFHATIHSGMAQLWTATSAPSNNWYSVAISQDGSKLIAGGNRLVFTSTNYGLNWKSNNLPELSWTSAACSADGRVLIVGAYYGDIYCSTNAGVDWWLTSALGGGGGWDNVASSADGSKLVAVSVSGRIFTSSDFGMTWQISGAPGGHWQAVASSADGNKLAAAHGGHLLFH